MTNRSSDRGSSKPVGVERSERVDLIRTRSADFIRASSHAVLREQAEHIDAPDRCSSPHKKLLRHGVRTHTAQLSYHCTATRVQEPSTASGQAAEFIEAFQQMLIALRNSPVSMPTKLPAASASPT